MSSSSLSNEWRDFTPKIPEIVTYLPINPGYTGLYNTLAVHSTVTVSSTDPQTQMDALFYVYHTQTDIIHKHSMLTVTPSMWALCFCDASLDKLFNRYKPSSPTIFKMITLTVHETLLAVCTVLVVAAHCWPQISPEYEYMSEDGSYSSRCGFTQYYT